MVIKWKCSDILSIRQRNDGDICCADVCVGDDVLGGLEEVSLRNRLEMGTHGFRRRGGFVLFLEITKIGIILVRVNLISVVFRA